MASCKPTHVPDWNANVHLVLREPSVYGVYVEGEHTWAVCRSDVIANQALFRQQLSAATGIPCGDSENGNTRTFFVAYLVCMSKNSYAYMHTFGGFCLSWLPVFTLVSSCPARPREKKLSILVMNPVPCWSVEEFLMAHSDYS